MAVQTGASVAKSAAAAPGRLIRLADGRRINLNCIGRGSPTVVFEGGYAADSQAWTRIQPQVSKLTRACSYDRAGYGQSDMGPLPRDAAAVAQDLDETLRLARVDGPFVMVGHSAGALYVRAFASRRPKDVVGMVLADPAVPYEDLRLSGVAGPGAGSLAALRAIPVGCLADTRAGTLFSNQADVAKCLPGVAPSDFAADLPRHEDAWRTEISELDALWGASSDEVHFGKAPSSDMPLVVLTADGTFADAPDPLRSPLSAAWVRLHKELAALSSHGVERVVHGSSHMMIVDQPDAVIAAIREVVAAARSRAGPSATEAPKS